MTMMPVATEMMRCRNLCDDAVADGQQRERRQRVAPVHVHLDDADNPACNDVDQQNDDASDGRRL
ncbi:MAG: hypothetical protein WDM89_06800 [Rhizomicrobium sp.]